MATTVSLKPNAVEISGSTSGTTTLQATAVAGTTTLTLPAATDTLVGKATTDTLTNKTLTGAAMNGTLGATTPSTVVATTVKANTTIGVGAATPSASGAGITFPATQSVSSNANTLDDYEEGTWTPTVTFGGGSTGITYGDNSGVYVKIANKVTIQCTVFFSSLGSSTGDIVISGLPFPSFNSGFQRNGGYGFYDRVTPCQVLNIENTTGFSLLTQSSGIASTAVTLTHANFASNSYMSISFSYFV